MISNAEATVIPMAHPITPPKLAAIRKCHEKDLFICGIKIIKVYVPSMSTIV